MSQPQATKPPRILITNAHSVANAGDFALLAVTIDELRRVFPGSAITAAIGDAAPLPGYDDVPLVPALTTHFKRDAAAGGGWRPAALLLLPLTLLRIALFIAIYRLTHVARPALLPADYRPLLAAYTNADLVVSSAGNFLFASGRLSLPLALQFVAILLAIWLGKPTYTMPQTLGPLAERGAAGMWQRRALRALATQLRILQVRDEPSQQLVRQVRAPLARVIVSPDVALLYGLRPLGARSVHEPPRLGVTLVNWGAQNRRYVTQSAYEEAVARACRWFVATCGGEVHLFAQVTGPLPSDDDRVPARRVAGLLADVAPSVRLHDSVSDAAALQRDYGDMDIMLGTRLHSTLFAMVAGTPVAAVAYQPKTRGVFALLGLAEWTLPIEETFDDAVQVLVARLWTRRVEVAQHLARAVPAAQRQAASAADRIADDFLRRA